MNNSKVPEATVPRRVTAPTARPRRRLLKVVWSPDRAAIGREILLEGPPVELGREIDGPGRIADDCLSRQHLRVERSASASLEQIEDLGSSNGTFVNGERCTKKVPAAPGTVISAGDTLLVVEQEADTDRLQSSRSADEGLVSEIIGQSTITRALRRSIATVAKAEMPVMLLGPTGAGKEVAAGAIHRLSGRKGAWLPINCAAIPESIADAEFFGIAEGVATGTRAREGYFVQASGGTLFLDELGDLPLSLQAKLLRVLQDGVVYPLGGEPRKVDVRVIAATNVDLEASGFRQDLRTRLAGWELYLAPLSERRADVLPLWQYFMQKAAPERPIDRITPEFAEALLLHDWPGNVRELSLLARRIAVLVEPEEMLDADRLPAAMGQRLGNREDRLAPSHQLQGPDDTLDPHFISRERLEEALSKHSGNISEVGRALGIPHREQVYRMCRRAGLDPKAYRRGSVEPTGG